MKVLVIGGTLEEEKELFPLFQVAWPSVKLVSMDGLNGLTKVINTESPDLIVLYPHSLKNSLGMLEEIRRFAPEVLIMIFSRDTSISTEVKWLSLGADEYISLPFNKKRLLARVDVLLRRNPRVTTKRPIACGDLVIDGRKVTIGERVIKLTPTESRVFRVLMENAGETVSSYILLRRVWPNNGNRNAVKVFIRNLRKKLEEGLENPRIILTERGEGYKVVSPEKAREE